MLVLHAEEEVETDCKGLSVKVRVKLPLPDRDGKALEVWEEEGQ